MSDFEQTLERRDGGRMILSVSEKAITLTIPPPVSPNEREAMAGLKSLSEALKRDVAGDVQAREGAISLVINTPNGRDGALAIVAANSLETHDVLSQGESVKFEAALRTYEAASHQRKTEPVSKELSDIHKAAAAIGSALKGMVSGTEPSVAVAVAGQGLPGKSEGRGIG